MSAAGKVRVLLVEDSDTQREVLAWVIRKAPNLELVGEATNGREAVEMVRALRPDIVLMDCHMPVMDGVAATREIMQECPVPILIVSASAAASDVHPGLDAMREGALAIVPKPIDPGAASFESQAEELRLNLRLMSEVQVVRRRPRRTAPTFHARERSHPAISLIAIGASTGGPPAVMEILRASAGCLKVPVLIVQHMAPGFSTGFASWLSRASGVPVSIAVDRETARPGCAYVAPDDYHLGIDRLYRLRLDQGPPEDGFRPSVSYLFSNVADTFGAKAMAILLTGMGEDGARGLADVARAGGVTVAQNKETSVVFGMPGVAVRMGAARHVLTPSEIADLVVEQMTQRSVQA